MLAAMGEMAGSALLFGMRAFATRPAQEEGKKAVGHVLIAGAHPDDEIMLGAGLFSEVVRRGGQLTVLIVCNGGGSRAGGLTPGEMVARRAGELRASAEILGVTRLVHLGCEDYTWRPEEVRGVLAEEIQRADLVCTHSPVDYHPDHLRLCRLVSELASPGQRIWLGELQTLLTPLLSNRVVEMDAAEVAMREAAAEAHATQAGTLHAVRRQMRLLSRVYGGRRVMAFWELDGAAFRRVTSAAAAWIDAPERTPFRGVRLRGFSDPLAVLGGTRARLRLRRTARDNVIV